MRFIIGKIRILGVIAFIGIMALLPAQPALAVDVIGKGVCDGNGANSVACQKTSGNPIFGPDGVITFAINIMTVVIGIAAVIMIILAGLKLITSGSNPQEVSKAREMLIYAIVGVVIAVSAQLIVRIFISNF